MSRRIVASYSACCPTCGAGQGEPCIIPAYPRPRRAHYTHAPRKRFVAALTGGDDARP